MKKNKLCLIAATVAAISMSTQICSLKIEATAIESNYDYVTDNYSFPEYAFEIVLEYSSKYPDKYGEICDIVQMLLNSDSYNAEYNYCADSAVAAMKRTLDAAFDVDASSDFPVPYGADYHGMFYADYTVPVVEQINNGYCGPATVLQTLIGNGILSNTTSNKNKEAQEEQANAMGTDRGTSVSSVMNRMNSYYSSSVYACVYKTPHTSRTTLINYMTTCFTKRRCPIVDFFDTSGLGYYNGISYHHLMTISAIDDIRKTIVLVDPLNDPIRGGVHTVTYDEFFESIVDYKGCIIC